MGGEWREVEFASFCDITRGASPRPIHEWIADEGIPWVKISDASTANSRFIERTAEKIRPEGRAKSVPVFPGDLILSNSATPGIPMFVNIEACIHDGWLLLRNFRGVDKLFCYYLLLYERPRIVRQGSGTVFTNLKTEILKRHRVRLPSLPEQRAIAHILGTLDDKIELNRRMNQTLEAIARAIFKSWFVDFDPVIDNALAAGKPIPEEFAERAARRAQLTHGESSLPESIRRLFPDEFQDSELGPIPTGWEVKPLSALMTFQGGSQPPASEFISEPRPGYVRLVQIRDFYTSSHVTYVPDTPKLRKFTIDDIMIARYGSSGNAKKTSDSLGRICRGLEGAYNVALVKVIPHGPWREFLYYFLQTSSFQSVIKGMGARSVQSGFRKGDLDVIWVVSPSLPVLSAFEGFADFIWKHTYKTNERSRTLAALRNTLLPKLISGKIRVKDAEWSLRGGRA